MKLSRFTVVTRQWADAVNVPAMIDRALTTCRSPLTTLLDLLPSLITTLIYVMTPLEELA